MNLFATHSLVKTVSWIGLILLGFRFAQLPIANADFQRDAAGWTILSPSASSRIVYVSSSEGDDGNDGLTPATAVKTVAKGKSLTRDNSNDYLLFRRGDTWNESFGDLFRSGLSAAQPFVISAYGTGDRPLFNTGSTHGVMMWSTGYANSHGGGYSNIVFNGLHFRPDTYTGAQPGDNPAGFRIDRPGENLLFEDMYIEGYATNIVVQSVGSADYGSNIQVRRSVVVDAFALRGGDGATWDLPGSGTGTDNGYPGGSHSQGLYASRIDGLLIEENVFDHNGWREGVPGAERTIYNHNLYIQRTNTPDVTVRGNIIANGAANAAQLRNGGVLEDNLFVGNGTGAFIHQNDPGVTGRAERNVFLDSSRDIQYALADPSHGGTGPRNGGLSMGNVSGSEANHNLFLHTLPNDSQGLRNTTGVSTEGNLVFQWGNTGLSYDAEIYDLPFPDPERQIGDYDSTIGGLGTTESFLEGARQLSRENWNPDYFAKTVNSYFFDGFGLTVNESADFNGDGSVNGNDFLAWQRGFGVGTSRTQGDANGSGTVDSNDLLIWQTQYGNEPITTSALPVPEPNSLAILLVSVGIVVCCPLKSWGRRTI